MVELLPMKVNYVIIFSSAAFEDNVEVLSKPGVVSSGVMQKL